jgi:hypothetical protein
VGLSCTGIMLIMVSMKKELKDEGYKIDFDEMNNYNGPISLKEIMNSLKITPFIPIFNITEMSYFMRTYINDREHIYLFLSSINAIKEIENEKDDDEIDEDKIMTKMFEKLIKWYQITMLSNKDISDEDLDTMFSTLNYIKKYSNDNELLNRVYKFEQELEENNITNKNDYAIHDVNDIKESKEGYQRILKRKHKK